MQPNTITLSVDEQNDGVGPVDHVFTRFDEDRNRSVYIHTSHTMSAKDQLILYRTLPKPSGNFRGVLKSAFKFSKDYVVLGVDGVSQLTAPVIIETTLSVPVGITAAQALLMRQRDLSLMDLDTIMIALSEQGMI